MRYLLRVNHTNEYADHHQYAVLEIDPQLARLVLERKRRFQAMTQGDSSLCDVSYYNYSPDWHDTLDVQRLAARGWLSEEALADFDSEGICVLSDDADLADADLAGESSGINRARMVIYSFGVSWVASCRYTSDEFSTETLSFEVFEEVAAQHLAAQPPQPA